MKKIMISLVNMAVMSGLFACAALLFRDMVIYVLGLTEIWKVVLGYIGLFALGTAVFVPMGPFFGSLEKLMHNIGQKIRSNRMMCVCV